MKEPDLGWNSPQQSIYYKAVKLYYERMPTQYKNDLDFYVKENDFNNIDLSQIAEVYNFARFV
jgi:hypothetical protein